MRIMQIGNSHTDYLTLFAKRFRRLDTHAAMMQAYIDDYYWCSHTYIPVWQRMGHETFFCVPTEFVSQQLWCREHGVPFDSENPFLTILAQVQWFQPDVLYIGSASMYHDALLQYLPYRPKVVIGWHATVTHPHMKFSLYDVIISSHEECLYIAKQQGAPQVAFAYPGIPAELGTMFDRVKRTDVCFTGYWAVSHPRRNAFLADLASRAAGMGIDCAYHLGFYNGGPECPPQVLDLNRGAVWGKSMFRAFASTRIVLNGYVTMNYGAQTLTPNMRQLEGMGVGSFLLTEQSPNLSAFFTEGEDLATYATADELEEKIRYYLAHEDERERIAAHGLATCTRYYSMEIRTKALMDIVDRLKAPAMPPLEIELRTLATLVRSYANDPGIIAKPDVQHVIAQALLHARKLLLTPRPVGAPLLAEHRGGLQILDQLDALPVSDMMHYAFCRGMRALYAEDTDTAWKCMQEELERYPENDMARQQLSTMALHMVGQKAPQDGDCPPLL